MQIVDAQVHIWSSGTPSVQHRPIPSYSVDDLIAEMDPAGVHAAIIHPPGWDPNAQAVAEAAVHAHPGRFAILGSVPPADPASRSRIAGWMKQPGMLGLRWALLAPEQKDWPTDGTMDWIWPVAEAQGIPVALLAGRFLPAFRRIAERYPQLKLIIDHCGLMRFGKGPDAFITLPDLLPLAKLPNVAVKMTGAPTYSLEEYPYRDLHDGLHQIFDAFGPERYFWGTDITRMPCSWTQCRTLFAEELPWLNGRDLERVMGGAICDWLNWHPTHGT
jgi:predicted TIM-barrel fold metal-dependent hydrolase